MQHFSRISLAILSSILFLLPITAQSSEKLTVILEWFVNPDHAPIIVAKEKGFFADAGLDVDLVAPADPNDPPKMVASGKADIGISYQPQLHVHVDEGLPVVRIGTLVATPLVTMMVMPDGPVKTPADLKGRKIGYSVGFYRDTLLPAMLGKHDLSLDDVETVSLGFALSPALISERVDATIGAFRNFEINQMEAAGHPGHAIYPEDEGVPGYDELIFIAKKDNLNDPRLRAFLDGMEMGVRYLINHPAESWAAFIAAYPDLNDALNKRAWRDTVARFALRPAALDSARYERFAAFLHKLGLLKTVPPLADYAVELR
ncbi:MAG: ABC transporter substrate-binding protein [Rhodospirillales bacterium]|jgi:putative hydroxymethylpyrimidine transport system substrate-binding protein|nr:ABC transporter substrate-binding protein [Rhodospirillales bacterium]